MKKLSVILILTLMVLTLVGCTTKDKTSIGGADGPTAVYVTSD